jgi:branched-subunit amino acid transport protein
MNLWLTLAAVAAASAALKAAGPALVGSRELPPGARNVVAYLAPALLAALTVAQTFGAGERLVLDVRALGLATAAVALALRAPALLAVALAAGATALVRALT